jgi:tol-pal system protein YbgF
VRRGLSILAIMKRHGPKIEGATSSLHLNDDKGHPLKRSDLGGSLLVEEKLQKADWIKGWIILSVVLFLWGCATTQDVQILDGAIYKLQSQLNLIQKEKDSIRNELESLQEETQKDISTLRNETQQVHADLLLRLENLQSDLQVLSTGVEEYKEFLKRPAKEVDRVKEDMALKARILEEKGKTIGEKSQANEDRIKALEERFQSFEDRLKELDGKIEKLASQQIESEKPTSTKETLTEMKGISARVGDLYKDAYETFQKGDLGEARRKFEAFLKQYPNTELSDNAQFWLGETYYLKKDFEKAILEYEKAIAKYPEGDKIPAALFKQALAFLELGDKTNARNLLKRVIQRYPHSDQAEMAEKKLETIK